MKNLEMRGELEIKAYRNGELIHHDGGSNVVTIWAKHATMHLLTGETYSSHGTISQQGNNIYSGRSTLETDHQDGINNADGTLISGEQYLGSNLKYYDNVKQVFKYWNMPNNLNVNSANGDAEGGSFRYPFFPTKMLFGTGREYKSWADVSAAGRAGDITDITSYKHPKNGGWTGTGTPIDFNDSIDDVRNYYSNIFDPNWVNPDVTKGPGRIVQARTVNDVYSGVLDGDPPADTDFAITGAIKDGTYDGSLASTKLETVDGKLFSTGRFRGIGRPAFIYCRRDARFFSSTSEARLQQGSTTDTNFLESKITFTVEMPEQPNGEFYPYNGYTLKVAGLFADARMLLGNTVPQKWENANTFTDTHEYEYFNYLKQPCGLMWAKRKIAPIYKSHDTKIVAQWTIYL